MGISTRKRTGERVAGRPRGANPPQRSRDTQAEPPMGAPAVTLHAARSGQWIEAEAIRRWAVEQPEPPAGASPANAPELILDLSGLEHLDTSALQILLALDREQRQRGGQLRLENPSASLRRWFDYAGAGALLGSTAPTGDRVSASGEDA